MSKQQAAIRKMLEALSLTYTTVPTKYLDLGLLDDAIVAGKAMLEQPEPVQEPVAIVIATNHMDGRVKWLKPFSQGLPLGTKFYTTPPAQPAIKHLPADDTEGGAA